MAIKSEPKKQIIKFIKTAKMDEPFTFTVAGTVADAEKYVQRMRVELSRLREMVRERNQTPRMFKMLLKEMAYCKVTRQTHVTLMKSANGHIVIPEDVQDAVDFMSEED